MGSEVTKGTPRRGRPPLDNPRSERVFLRVTAAEAERLRELAESRGQTLSDYLRESGLRRPMRR